MLYLREAIQWKLNRNLMAMCPVRFNYSAPYRPSAKHGL
jgi:hypothetical protein